MVKQIIRHNIEHNHADVNRNINRAKKIVQKKTHTKQNHATTTCVLCRRELGRANISFTNSAPQKVGQMYPSPLPV